MEEEEVLAVAAAAAGGGGAEQVAILYGCKGWGRLCTCECVLEILWQACLRHSSPLVAAFRGGGAWRLGGG